MSIEKTVTNLETLKINYLTEAMYEDALENDQINENELYMTPSNSTSVPTADTLAEFDSTAHMNSTDMTTAEVTSFVNSLDLTGSKAADYIVEQGTSGMWTYRKWNSGVAECWGKYTASIAVNTASSGYGGYRSAELSIPTFPLTFAASPSITATANSSQGFWVNNISAQGTTDGKFFLSAGSSLAAASRSIAFYVVGRWK